MLNGFSPPVKSFVQKTNPHTIRGVRLIVYSSLLAYLNQQLAASERMNRDGATKLAADTEGEG